ncbi:hypothetical protein DQ04_09541000 [Trypanosoma grayi]|uniref:hypothetical protein n=1 Tax=Trypanosoma grayi TaxID=71804 RepID=UPI0004F41DFF|nr:hypothetical protein DQ04_09541000 [Trypanosoma grayi]KEG07523.1 hypothetical protein DQ04_09541000 [Trypanosoma grayi]
MCERNFSGVMRYSVKKRASTAMQRCRISRFALVCISSSVTTPIKSYTSTTCTCLPSTAWKSASAIGANSLRSTSSAWQSRVSCAACASVRTKRWCDTTAAATRIARCLIAPPRSKKAVTVLNSVVCSAATDASGGRSDTSASMQSSACPTTASLPSPCSVVSTTGSSVSSSSWCCRVKDAVRSTIGCRFLLLSCDCPRVPDPLAFCFDTSSSSCCCTLAAKRSRASPSSSSKTCGTSESSFSSSSSSASLPSPSLLSLSPLSAVSASPFFFSLAACSSSSAASVFTVSLPGSLLVSLFLLCFPVFCFCVRSRSSRRAAVEYLRSFPMPSTCLSTLSRYFSRNSSSVSSTTAVVGSSR